MLFDTLVSIALTMAVTLVDISSARVSHFRPISRNAISRRGSGDAIDHSDIKKWAALGDSFAAGIGAGTRLTGWGDWYCSRYDGSYPSVINSSPSLGSATGRDFKYYACSGAVTTDIMGQIKGLNGLQMATLSVGGNDANLKDILHACIYQWNKDPQLDCDKTLANSQSTIESPTFSKNLDDVLNALKGVMANSDAKIYWTGYSHFWDASTDQCDQVTWAFKYNIGHRQYLTQSRRATMNNLVDAVNQKIKDAISRFGRQAIFVPWGPDVDYIGGHYCQPGVDEWNAVDREQTTFYEWGTTKDDPDGKEHDELRKRQQPGQLEAGQDLQNTWEGAIAAWVMDAIKQGATAEDFDLTQDDIVHAQSGSLLPDKYGRIFHPTRFAHMMIAENILRTMDLSKAKSMGQKAATSTLIGGPVPTGTASHPGQHVFCNVNNPDNEKVKFKVADADTVVKTYCLKHQSNVVGSGPEGEILEQYQNGNDQSTSLVLIAELDSTPLCEKYPNLGKLNFFDCSANFGSAMNDCKFWHFCVFVKTGFWSLASYSSSTLLHFQLGAAVHCGQLPQELRNGAVPAEDCTNLLIGDTNTVDAKLGGEQAADCIYYSIRAVRGGTTTTTSPSAPAPPARTCSLHLVQKGSYSGASPGPFGDPNASLEYTVEVTIYDGTSSSKKQIGYHDKAVAGARAPLGVTMDGVKDTLVITPEQQNDYVQFALGSQMWKSSDRGSCTVGGWDPRQDFPAVSFIPAYLLLFTPFLFIFPFYVCSKSSNPLSVHPLLLICFREGRSVLTLPLSS